jgi:signal transduction histidine kinase
MGVINLAQLVHDRSSGHEELQAWTSEIMAEGQRIAKIVRSLQAFSQQEVTERVRVEIKDIIDDVVTLVRRQLKKDEIVLELELAAGLPMITCRRQQIEQVLINLINNARDALVARFQSWDGDKVIRITCLQNPKTGWLEIQIEDHGIGIQPEVRDQIFDPFFTTKSRHKASGLGLAVSYGIVREHGGTLSFESEPGKRTVFTLGLPID